MLTQVVRLFTQANFTGDQGVYTGGHDAYSGC